LSGLEPAAWGIAAGHHHVRGDWVPAPERGVAAALVAMGATPDGPGPTPTWVIRKADGLEVPFDAVLETEDGGSAPVRGVLAPEGLPLGYHSLIPADGSAAIRLIVSPGACPIPSRAWGWAVQLYAARSASSWGMGDLADLRRLAGWSASAGAGMLLINPLHAVAPTPDQQASPYFPASRRWRNPLYLRIEEVPGATGLGAQLDELAAAGRALNADRLIDRAAVWRLKRAALEHIWARQPVDPPPMVRWAEGQGPGLTGFAIWSALSDEHGPDWRVWPGEYQHPSGPAVARFAADHADVVRFHSWLQWLLSGQLAAAAGVGPALVSDLAIGADPGGADAWQWQDVLAPGVTVGAPPDEFSPAGQDWGLPPFDPWRLRAAGYGPFRDVVRSAVAGGGGVRVDHVAGLFRLFWVPAGSAAAEGVYVRYPWRDLLNVLALEVDRAGGFAIGEDLGTVEDEAREALAAWSVLSYRLVLFEPRPPEQWPELALAAVTTHDLPTVSGVWTGADLAGRRQRGLPVDDEAERGLRANLEAVCGTSHLEVGEAVRRTYAALSRAPSLLVAATLDDALEVDERPNMPGTVDEWPNWSLALPAPLEEIEHDERVKAVTEAIGRGRSVDDGSRPRHEPLV
jgi:4-alpha-glucanotransferase